jgi:MFS family permease
MQLTLFKPLHNRPFALLWSGQTISRLGDSLYRIALSWWVLEKTGSAAVMGMVLIFSFTPMLIFSLLGGVVADRFSRLKVMIVSDLLRGIVVLSVSLLASNHLLEVWHILIASSIFGLVDAFFQPAYTAVFPERIPRELLPGANSLNTLGVQFAEIAGPVAGAILVKFGGSPFAFALDGISFFCSAACLFPLLPAYIFVRPESYKTHIGKDLKAGIQSVAASPWLWITILIAAFINMTISAPISVALPFLVKDHLHKNVGALGTIYSFFSIGSVLGAVWIGRYSRLHRRGLVAYGTWFASGLSALIFSQAVSLEAALAAALLQGAAAAAFGLIWINTLQEMVPIERLGRVASIDNLGSFVLLPVGYALAGLLTDQIGAPLVFGLGGLLTILLTVSGLSHPAVRNLD